MQLGVNRPGKCLRIVRNHADTAKISPARNVGVGDDVEMADDQWLMADLLA